MKKCAAFALALILMLGVVACGENLVIDTSIEALTEEASQSKYDHWQEAKTDSHVVLVPEDYIQQELSEGLGYFSPDGRTCVVIVDFPSEYLQAETSSQLIGVMDKLIELYSAEQNVKNEVVIQSVVTNDGIKRFSENIMVGEDGTERYFGIITACNYGEGITVVIESEDLEESLLLEVAAYIEYLYIDTDSYYDFRNSFEIDVSDLTFEQMAELRDQILEVMMYSDEWQSVEVPQGVYQVGVDIPAGKWTISADVLYPVVEWGSSLDEYGVSIEDQIDKMSLGDGKSVDWNLTEGTYIHVQYNPVIFTPYAGKPDLGFK